jgi:hypothetical protein
MRVFGAFIAAVSGAATIFALEFLIEGLVAGVPLSLSIFVFGVALNLVVGLPAALVGGVPIWIVFRYGRIHSPLSFAMAGAALALITYLLLVGMGMGQPSDHSMTFTENLGRLFHIPRIAAAIIAGAGGAIIFWLIAVRRILRKAADPALIP